VEQACAFLKARKAALGAFEVASASSKVFLPLLVRETRCLKEVPSCEYWFWVALGRSMDAQREDQQQNIATEHRLCHEQEFVIYAMNVFIVSPIRRNQ
jgi:hypothetical protein